ncbi:MAG: lipopolysaccharide heptosyltransferase II [Planctomycetota bacterium]|nr:MAG: lipopolysaccharide heptosyltransferase II [Planctomycetota bacterium]GDY08386.1 lipopolysaccharide heptosyltransferase I [Planctomycetia bacterium]
MATASLNRRLDELDVRRICVIKPSALGDVVQSLPLLSVLRERFPHAEISWVINHEFADLLEGHPLLHELLHFHRRGGATHYLQLLQDLRQRQFDLVFDLQGLMRSGVMAAATGAPLRVGLESSREGASLACHVTIPGTSKGMSAFQRYWRIAEELGLGDRKPQTIVPTTDADHAWAADSLSSLTGPILAIHPGARWMTKRWPIEKFAVVAHKAMRQFGFSVMILGSKWEMPVANELQTLLNGFASRKAVLNLTGQTTLKQLSAVLSSVDVVLTNDSGPMHLAAGLGTSVLGVFTCTSPTISGPPGEQHELVATQVACAASYKKICPFSGRMHQCCMDELSTERVCAALVRLIEKRQLHSRAA